MGNTPSPNVSRALITGAVMAGAGVALFLILYVMLGGMDTLPRLLIALIAPPVVLSAIFIGYMMRGGKKP